MTQTRYSGVAMTLHWLIAAAILTNVGIAWYFNSLEGLAKMPAMQIHKSLGITILLLSLIRLAWRLFKPPPPLKADLKPWERWLAEAVHCLFYLVMIALPLTGWATVSASPLIHVYPINMFGLFHWPEIAPLTNLPKDQMHAAKETFEAVHGLLAKLIVYILFPLHVLGALKHQFLDRDHELGRMIPFLKAPL
ncbi:cytochrome b561 [Caulobacter ginsengisoli]|uniref:Cytochrome b561 n=1 Tax=Caulobacter ginsengisoli TaxID=400775 RepID=A0ABU0IZA8_9CAUL|nr:cytochrome b [Caulobacter ginsengisoli]MDQ0466680.1 cytochrome b561 [Caulobacter ginsengisoli]